jgi:tetratricopeptide (TPR) repeat protein
MGQAARPTSELEPKPAALLGQRVAFTGRFETLARRAAESLVRRAAGTVAGDVTPRVTMLVVGMRGWPLLESGRVTRQLEAAERLRASGHGIRIVSETEFRETLGLDPRPDAAAKTLSAAQVAAALGTDERTLERWEQLSLIRSTQGRYDFRDLVSLRTITNLVARGVSPVVIRRSLDGLRGLLPGIDRPLAQLNILVSDSGGLVAELEESLLSPTGQMELRFEPATGASTQTAPAPAPLSLARELAAAEARSSESWVRQGLEREAAGDLAEAERAYRKAAALAPSDPSPQFNLGNVLMASGRLEAAAERYSQAVSLDPLHARAWYNLAHVNDELGRQAAAMRFLRRAVACDPSFADAQFNLADVAERLGDRQTAETAWVEYLRLEPVGNWAVEARRRLHALRSRAWA